MSADGTRVVLDGVHATFNPQTTGLGHQFNTSGEYQLQVRINETQEVPGSTVKYADLRYAQTGISLEGFPQHSPLLGETTEETPVGQVIPDASDSFAGAQNIGNLLKSDQNTISVSGRLDNKAGLPPGSDVDWYRLTVDYQAIQSIQDVDDLGSIWSTIFDVDYASGMARPDLKMWVFDANSQLILVGGDSNVGDDRATPLPNARVEDLSRGSLGAGDPFIGTAYLRESNSPNFNTYYVAITSALATSQELNDALSPLTRREPINSVKRIATEHFSDPNPSPYSRTNYNNATYLGQRLAPIVNDFTLADVVFYVLTERDLYMVNPFTGYVEVDMTTPADALLGGSNTLYRDLAMRNDGRLYTITGGLGGGGAGSGGQASFRRFDTGDARQFVSTTATGITTYEIDPAGNGTTLRVDPNGGVEFQAIAHTPDSLNNSRRNVFAVGSVNVSPGVDDLYRRNLMYVIRTEGSGAGTAITHPTSTGGARVTSDVIPFGQLDTTVWGDGNITGLTYLGNQMYAVDDKGHLYRVSGEGGDPGNPGSWGFRWVDPQQGFRYILPTGGGPQLNHITQVTYNGQPIVFSGLTAGPKNVEGGRYANSLFATDTSGNIYALQTDGTVQPIFVNTNDLLNTNVTGRVTGLAFSPIDYNLWHMTDNRSADAGHGVRTTYDRTRNSDVSGQASMYFGLEDPRGNAGYVWNQPGAANFYQGKQSTDQTEFGSYNMPGGAHGSFSTSTFSLKGYAAQDKPVVYFSYYADTENSLDYDGARVYISNDGANWDLVATNTDTDDGGRLQDGIGRHMQTPAVPTQITDEIVDSAVGPNNAGGSWRQARVDLSRYAGKDNLRLRFDFSTASDMEIADTDKAQQSRHYYLAGVPAAQLRDGDSFTLDAYQFVFDLGYEVDLPNVAGRTIADGNTLVVKNVTFEFDENRALTNPAHKAIAINDTMTTDQVAAAIRAAVQDPANGLPGVSVAIDSSDYAANPLRGDKTYPTRLFFDGMTSADTLDVAGTPSMTLRGTPNAPANNVIKILPGWTSSQVAEAIRQVVSTYTSAGGLLVFGNSIIRDGGVGDLLHLYGHVPTNAGPLPWSDPNKVLPNDTGITPKRSAGALPGDWPWTKTGFGGDGGGPARDRYHRLERTQDNFYEGFFVDDIIIGFAERGEMVTEANQNNVITDFDFERAPDKNLLEPTMVVEGSYQLEIRHGTEYASLNGVSQSTTISNWFDTNDRLARDFTLLVPAVANISHGQSFEIYDGRMNQKFVFLDQTTQGGGGAAGVPIYFTANDSFDSLGKKVAAAINGVAGFKVKAVAIASSRRVDLFGATRVDRLPVDTYPTTGNGNTNTFDDGDRNHERQKGQIILDGNSITYAQGWGIDIGPAPRDDWPHAGSGRTLNDVNQLVPGIMVSNNLVAYSGTGGIRLRGDTGDPNSAIPFARIVNNTVYGAGTRQGTGILVADEASPTMLNNIVANLNVGISVDASSVGGTVLGGSIYQNTNQPTAGIAQGSFDRQLGNNDPLFVDAARGNFYLQLNSEAIDSAIDSVEERGAFYNTVLQPMGIPVSPIIAPDYDLFGQLRKDDPDVNPPPSPGLSVFKDRGAIDRVDFDGPVAALVTPDTDDDAIDRDPSRLDAFIVGATLTQFKVRLDPGGGTPIDDATMLKQNLRLFRDGQELAVDSQYFFIYDPTKDLIRLTPDTGIWDNGHEYVIVLNRGAIRDMASNPLRANRDPDATYGDCYFKIRLAGLDFGDAPDVKGVFPEFPTLKESDGASHVVWGGLMLGNGVTTEPDGRQSSLADGDAQDNGVQFSSALWMGNDVTLTVTAHKDGAQVGDPIGFLNAWVDFNNNASWDDTITDTAGQWSEHIVFVGQTGAAVALKEGPNTLTLHVPLGIGENFVFARFRFSSQENLGYTLEAPDGEVEDYGLRIVAAPEDFGDAPNAYHTLYSSTTIWHGPRHYLSSDLYLGGPADAEMDGQPDVAANGDDMNGSDDEDGIRFVTGLAPGGTAIAEITVHETTGLGKALLNGWVDFNRDGNFGVGEQVFTDLEVTNGVNNWSFDIPALGQAVEGKTFARFRLSRADEPGLQSDGVVPSTNKTPYGEIEDYQVTIDLSPDDYGDAPDNAAVTTDYPTRHGQHRARGTATRTTSAWALTSTTSATPWSLCPPTRTPPAGITPTVWPTTTGFRSSPMAATGICARAWRTYFRSTTPTPWQWPG